MGIRSPISNNYAMILGGLRTGVTPLDMAHAYETLATGGNRVFNPILGAPNRGPTGIAEIQCPVCPAKRLLDHPTYERVLPASIAHTVHDILTTVVQSGTGTQAGISGVDVAGKTGTTTNYGDAWFVGWTPQLTTAVWVGFPDKLVSMATDYNGAPVEGGTYPAIIWQNFMVQALQILANEAAGQAGQTSTNLTTPTGSAGTSPAGSGSSTAPTSTGTSTGTGASTTGAPTGTTPSGTGGGTGTTPAGTGGGAGGGTGTTPAGTGGGGGGGTGTTPAGTGGGGSGGGTGGAGLGGKPAH
jgi:penicillin-binding protein 1A